MSVNAVDTTVQTHTHPHQQHPNDVAQPFQRLSLSIPVDAKKYNIICLFLTHILNLDDPKLVLPQDPPLRLEPPEKIIEIIPNVVFPYDVWIKGDVTIKDIKIKTTMLQEINNMIEQDLTSHADQPVNVETTLSYYEKLLAAYKVYEFPTARRGSSNGASPSMLSNSGFSAHSSALREEDEENIPNGGHGHGNLKRITSNQSSIASQKAFSANGTPSYSSPSPTMTNSKRFTANTRDFLVPRKRFSVLMGHNNSDDANNTSNNYPNGAANSHGNITHANGSLAHNNGAGANGNDQALNSILGKSRIYNKIKKHRESAGSLSSNVSRDSSYSTNNNNNNRNSVSTTLTTNSSVGSRRRSSATWSPEVNEHRFGTPGHPGSPTLAALPALSAQQRLDNQKDKYDYYVHLIRLLVITERLLTIVVNDNNKSGYNDKWVKYLDFIKKRILKFIIIDTTQMIMDYAKVKPLCSTVSATR
ncbi:uncharacterized protein RJT20DRAFT_57347 [Scheffersomyces xylosifermentans]|uniref:uncharacterized protein n=1 Tax=Scheffersomyces xylosifermentans TaxID=1304137 RepID=UPI00315CACF0